MTRSTCLLLWLLLALQAACVHAKSPSASAAPTLQHPDYVDIQPGWKLRVVIPILKSGGYVLPSLGPEQSGSTVEVNSPDFVGYENALYRLESGAGERLDVRLIHCEAWAHGKKKGCRKPSFDLFHHLDKPRFLRMLYLTRVSSADHDVVFIAANDKRALEASTAGVTQRASCESAAMARCILVPQGISVNIEEK